MTSKKKQSRNTAHALILRAESTTPFFQTTQQAPALVVSLPSGPKKPTRRLPRASRALCISRIREASPSPFFAGMMFRPGLGQVPGHLRLLPLRVSTERTDSPTLSRSLCRPLYDVAEAKERGELFGTFEPCDSGLTQAPTACPRTHPTDAFVPPLVLLSAF